MRRPRLQPPLTITSGDRGPGSSGNRTLLLATILAITLLPMLTSTPASAQDFVSEVTVVCCSSGTPAPPGYTRIDVDLNWGAGGYYLYLCYKKGVGAPITGLVVTLNSQTAPEGYTRIDVDLNADAGGDDIFLWYTKDPSCTAIRNVGIQVNNTTPPDGYTLIPVDLNRNAGGEYIYVIYEED